MKKEDLIIGITGTICAGKGTLVEALQEQGFAHFSVRGFLEEGLEKRGLEKSRDNLVNLANEWREKFGPHYIAERLYEQAQKQQKNAVIESIRNISEVDFLRENAGQSFYLIGSDAP